MITSKSIRYLFVFAFGVAFLAVIVVGVRSVFVGDKATAEECAGMAGVLLASLVVVGIMIN